MIKIGFALLSNSRNPLPSTRIACLNLFPYLRQSSFEPEIIFDPDRACHVPDVGNLVETVLARGIRVVVFQKLQGPSVLEAVERLKSAGIRTIYCVCDLVDNEMAAATDATIVVTEFLKSLYEPDLQQRIYVVHDGIERPEVVREAEEFERSGLESRALRASLVSGSDLYRIPIFSTPPRGWRVDVIGRFPPPSDRMQRFRAARWAFSTTADLAAKLALLYAILHPRIRHVPWSLEGVYQHLRASDIGIIPIDTSDNTLAVPGVPYWKTKSENRLTLNMAVGLPVIATPIASYEQVIEDGVNGFLARSREDWLKCFSRLRDPGLRYEMGFRARQSVIASYSKEAQATSFIAVLERVLRGTAVASARVGDCSGSTWHGCSKQA
jgi:hypothetical protein